MRLPDPLAISAAERTTLQRVIFDHVSSIVLFSVAGLAISYLFGKLAGVLVATVSAFVLRCTAALAIYAAFGLLAPDAFYYDSVATDITAGSSVEISAGKEGWPLILAGIYVVFGPSPELGLIVGATMSTLVVPLVAQTADLLGLPRQAASWVAALFPMTIVWGSLLLRESLTWFLLALCALGLVGLAKGERRWPYAITFLVALVGLSYARGPAALLMGVAGLLALAIVSRGTKLLVLAGSTLLAVGLVVLTPARERLLALLDRNSLDTIDAARETLSTEAETGWPLANSSGILGFIEAVSIATPRVALGPFPWEWLVTPAPLVADVILWVFVLGLVGVGIKLLPRLRDSLLLVLPSLAVAASLVLTSSNYGTMQRLRVQAVILLIPLAGAGIARLGRIHRDRRRNPDIDPDTQQVKPVENGTVNHEPTRHTNSANDNRAD